ncbi:MAG: aldose 1-epimerase [Parafilimonas sp.]
MAFTIQINKQEIFPVIYLKYDEEKSVAEIYSFGALLNAFTINKTVNIIDGFTSPQNAKDNIINGFKSAKLSPYVCRITKGEYAFNDHVYKIGKHFLSDEAIHGLLYDAPFSIVDSGANNVEAFVTLQYDYKNKQEGFPFAYRCLVTYSLQKNNSLTLTTTVENYSDTEMPVCDGWHPYFTLHAKVNDLTLQLNSKKILEFNDKLVPTGKVIAYRKFQQPEIFGKTFFDNCFLLNENNKPACILKNTKSGLQLTIQPDNSYPYLQLYTPENRNCIAIENLSAAPNAFNNKMGLQILKPKEKTFFKTTYSAFIKS